MNTPTHSDRPATDQATTASGGPAEVEQPGRPQRGGSVLARIPDVRPHLEDARRAKGKRRVRVDDGKPQAPATNALLKQYHSSWHVSPRLLAAVGLVVVVFAFAAYLRMRNDSAAPANRVDSQAPASSIGPAIDRRADGRKIDPLHSFGQRTDWRSHDHSDASQRAPDHFSERSSSQGDTQRADRFAAGEANTVSKRPDYRVGSTRRPPAGRETESNFGSNRYESSIPTDGRPIVTDPRVFARLSSEYDQNTTGHVPPARPGRQSIFPWRRSGQRLSWQQPSRQQPKGRSSAGTEPRQSSLDHRFSSGSRFDRPSSDTPAQQQYPDTGVGGSYFPHHSVPHHSVPHYSRGPTQYSDSRDYRSARSGTTLGDEARGSTYDVPRRGGASLDGRIEPPTYRVRR